MKTKSLIVIALILLGGCNEPKRERVKMMLQEPEMRNEIYQAIQNDSVMLRNMIVSIVSIQENPQTFPMRYRMLRLTLNSPTIDSLLVNDSQMRTNLLQKMLNETDHNTSFRAEMRGAVQRHKSLMTDLKKDLKVK